MGFSLAATTIFSLAAIGLYGLVYNIIHEEKLAKILGLKNPDDVTNKQKLSSYLLPLFAPLFTLIISNFEGLLEFMHARGIPLAANCRRYVDIPVLEMVEYTGTHIRTHGTIILVANPAWRGDLVAGFAGWSRISI